LGVIVTFIHLFVKGKNWREVKGANND
jgi:hypothetical protein